MTGLRAILLVASLLAPLALLGACLIKGWRERALALQWLAPLPGLAAGLLGLSGEPLTCDLPVVGYTFFLDASGALILVAAALLWITVTAALWHDGQPDNRFGVSWLLTMFGNIGVFIAGDLVSFYLFYALVSIPAYGLFAFSEETGQRRAGAIYMAFTIAGEALLLLAFALLATEDPHGSIRIADVIAALPASPWRNLILALIIGGFGMKVGLIPFNGWMPLNYSAAPIAAAAVLSGAGVKAGVIGLIRFLPLGGAAMEGWGEILVALGFLSAFYGVALGLTQKDPKAVLAYSSISQMGVIAAALGAMLAEGGVGLSSEIAFYAANHLLVKAALFLTIVPLMVRRTESAALILAAVLALSLAGLPLTGGALAKLVLKTTFASGLETVLATLSSIGTALLMTHFLNCIVAQRPGIVEDCPPTLVRFWPAVVLGAVLLPWALYPVVGDVSKALQPGNVLDALWPVAVGVVLAIALSRTGLSFVPAGDSVVLYERAFRRLLALGPWLETLEGRLRQWPAAGISLLLVVLCLLTAGIASR